MVMGFIGDDGRVKTAGTANPLPTTGGGAATVADGADVAQGAIADAAYTSGSGTVVALLKGIFARLLAVVIGAGEAHIGAVGGHCSPIYAQVTRTADTNAYIANDAIANATSGATLASALLGRIASSKGIITGLTLQNSNAAATHRVEIDLYKAAITAPNDNAEATALVGDDLNYLGTITLPALAKPTANSTLTRATVDGLVLPFESDTNRKVWFVVRTLDAHTPASGTVYTFCFRAIQD